MDLWLVRHEPLPAQGVPRVPRDHAQVLHALPDLDVLQTLAALGLADLPCSVGEALCYKPPESLLAEDVALPKMSELLERFNKNVCCDTISDVVIE